MPHSKRDRVTVDDETTYIMCDGECKGPQQWPIDGVYFLSAEGDRHLCASCHKGLPKEIMGKWKRMGQAPTKWKEIKPEEIEKDPTPPGKSGKRSQSKKTKQENQEPEENQKKTKQAKTSGEEVARAEKAPRAKRTKTTSCPPPPETLGNAEDSEKSTGPFWALAPRLDGQFVEGTGAAIVVNNRKVGPMGGTQDAMNLSPLAVKPVLLRAVEDPSGDRSLCIVALYVPAEDSSAFLTVLYRRSAEVPCTFEYIVDLGLTGIVDVALGPRVEVFGQMLAVLTTKRVTVMCLPLERGPNKGAAISLKSLGTWTMPNNTEGNMSNVPLQCVLCMSSGTEIVAVSKAAVYTLSWSRETQNLTVKGMGKLGEKFNSVDDIVTATNGAYVAIAPKGEGNRVVVWDAARINFTLTLRPHVHVGCMAWPRGGALFVASIGNDAIVGVTRHGTVVKVANNSTGTTEPALVLHVTPTAVRLVDSKGGTRCVKVQHDAECVVAQADPVSMTALLTLKRSPGDKDAVREFVFLSESGSTNLPDGPLLAWSTGSVIVALSPLNEYFFVAT